MSWASRRRTVYGFGTIVFLILVVGVPALYAYFSVPATCTDGKKNGGETSTDKGGQCLLLDERMLSPISSLWSRSFRIRNGSYNAVTYVHNPNEAAGARAVAYRFGLYDSNNVLVAERRGETFIMPGVLTPIFEGSIETGQRAVARTQFEFLETPRWERLENAALSIRVTERRVEGQESEPRLNARVENTSVRDAHDLVFIATLFDQAGNAFATSKTTLASLVGGASDTIVFTWPDPFGVTIGSIDIAALVAPREPRVR